MNKSADAYIRRTTDLTFSRFQLLDTLRQVGRQTQHGLAQAMGVSDPVVSRMLVELAAAGYVEIENDPNHGRRRLVSITQAGIERIQALGEVLERAFMELVRGAVDDTSRFDGDVRRILAELDTNGEIQ